MAQAKCFECDNCEREITAWSDNDAYYLNDEGKKVYAYHPNMDELEKCTDYESYCLCLDCGRKFKTDSAKPKTKCTKCKSTNFVDPYDLDEKPCPYCNEGVFREDQSFFRIS